MKIALVMKEFSWSRGGGEAYAVALGYELLKMGHEIHLFANRCEVPESLGLTFHRVPMIRKPATLKVLSFPAFLSRALAKNTLGGTGEPFDIIYGLTQFYPQDVHRVGGGVHRFWMEQRYASSLARLVGGLMPLNRAVLRVEKGIYHPGNFRRIITNSHLVAAHVCRYYGVPAERVKVIYNGVDTVRFNPQAREAHRKITREALGIDHKETAVLFVSTNFSRKGLPCLIRAMARVSRSHPWRLVVVGAGTARTSMREARRIGIGDRITFVGPTSQVERYYAAGDIFVLPSLYDPFANVCLEAMACGLPVITTRVNGASELIGKGGGIVLDDPRDDSLLAAAVKRLCDGTLARRLGEEAAEIAAGLTMEQNAKETVSLFQEVLEEKRNASRCPGTLK